MENEEIQLTDGQTENLPEVPEEGSSSDQLNALPAGCGEMTICDDRYYTKGEFEAAFNEFLIFLKSPQTSLDTFESLRAQGQCWRLVKSTRWRKNTGLCAGLSTGARQ